MPYQERGHGRRGRLDRKHDGHGKNKHHVGERGREALETIDVNSPVIKCFQQYAAQLDHKHDKYERLVKIGRDITIESKRIIFLLHTLDRDSKRESVLTEAAGRLTQLLNTHFKNIAKELNGEDPYQYMRSYSAGLQEYIEAMTFHHYLMNNSLESWRKIKEDLTFENKKAPQTEIKSRVATDDSTKSKVSEFDDTKLSVPEVEGTNSIEAKVDGTKSIEPEVDGTKSAVPEVDSTKATVTEVDSTVTEVDQMETFLSPMDYILGVADLTGELMRKCINNLGSGNIEGCYQTCTFVREIYTAFLSVNCTGYKELTRKLSTLRQSLSKMENACYTIHVRGSEIPKHMLADVIRGSRDDFLEEDEGFY